MKLNFAKKMILATLALAAPGLGFQQITSITCWGFGGTSCFQSTWAQAGSVGCSCSASCSNGNNISAGYSVTWNGCSLNASGQVIGGSGGGYVYVNGSFVEIPVSFSGYDRQFCDGGTAYLDFDGWCFTGR